MTAPLRFSRYAFKLSSLILLGAVELSPEQIGCSSTTWERLVRSFQLIRKAPRFGRADHWILCASGESQRKARRIRLLANLLREVA